MNKQTLKVAIDRLANDRLLSAFSEKSGVNRRTLQRIAASDNDRDPHPLVMAAIERTLKLKRFVDPTPAAESKAGAE